MFLLRNKSGLDIKEGTLYYAKDRDLKIPHKGLNDGHSCIVLSINKKRKEARVKTITSLEHKIKGEFVYDKKALNELKNGDILAIPKKDLNSKNFSAVHHNIRTIKIDKLERNFSKMKFPKRYKKLIYKK